MVKLEKISLTETEPINYFVSEIIASNKNHTKGIRKKNQKPNNEKKLSKKIDNIEFKSILTSWNNPLNFKGSNLCNHQLKKMFYEVASRVCANLADKWFASENYGIALKFYRQSLEWHLQKSNTEVFNPLILILEKCGNCLLSIVLYWDKIEQYINEFEIYEMCDFEYRKISLHNFKNCINKDLKLIPTRIIKSKESMMNAAKHCYLRALVLETDIEKKICLNKRLGILYNEYTEFYMNEIIKPNTPVTRIKFKWLENQLMRYFKLGSDIFKSQDNKKNFYQMHKNLANLYKSLAQNFENLPIFIKELIKLDNIYYKVINIYTKILSELVDRKSDSKLWDEINYDLFLILYYTSIQNYSKLSQDNLKGQRKCIKLFMEALKYCDLKNSTTTRNEYEFKSAIIHIGLGSVLSIHLEKYIAMKSPKVNSVLHKIESYYNTSFETFFEFNSPLDCLKVLKKMIILDMHFIDGTKMGTLHDVKHVKSIIKILKKYDTVFQKFFKNKDSLKNVLIENEIEDLNIGKNSNSNKYNILIFLNENVCKLLKCMMKLAITKTSKWLADNKDELKSIYGVLLKNNISNNNYSQLMIAINQLYSLSDNEEMDSYVNAIEKA